MKLIDETNHIEKDLPGQWMSHAQARPTPQNAHCSLYNSFSLSLSLCLSVCLYICVSASFAPIIPSLGFQL